MQAYQLHPRLFGKYRASTIPVSKSMLSTKREKKKQRRRGEGESYVRASPSNLCTSLLRLPSQLRPFAFTSSHSRVFALKAKVRGFARKSFMDIVHISLLYYIWLTYRVNLTIINLKWFVYNSLFSSSIKSKVFHEYF